MTATDEKHKEEETEGTGEKEEKAGPRGARTPDLIGPIDVHRYAVR